MFKTMTRNLLELSDWIAELGVTDVAMESTGVLWKPVYNILEDRFRVLLCNARHIKNVPGRKTDIKDCEWIAQLLQHGLLTASFVAHRPIRDLRDLTRQRAQIISERTREINRVHKILEDANIKLGAVASDIMGKSGRDMLRALIAGRQKPAEMAELARRSLRGKTPEVREALRGHVTDHHRYMLKVHMEHIEYLERLMDELTARIDELLISRLSSPSETSEEKIAEDKGEPSPLPFNRAVELASELPGIDVKSAQDVLAEIGTNMSQFPTAEKLAAWARICPGNNESAGKRKNGHTGQGNRWLRRALTQVAWAASRTKGTYLAAHYRRIAGRRGKKRAVIALSHTILVILYHMLKHHRHFNELGEDFFDRLNPERIKRYHVKRLESLGFKVHLEKQEEAA
jgi:transposase